VDVADLGIRYVMERRRLRWHFFEIIGVYTTCVFFFQPLIVKGVTMTIVKAAARQKSTLSRIGVSLTFVLALGLSAPVFAQGQDAAKAPPTIGLPNVPTTKILAIGRLTPTATPKAVQAILPQEVRDTVQLYLSGKIDQWYVRKDQASVVFILNMTNASDVRSMLASLPLGRANLMEFDLIPLGPLAPLAALESVSK